MHTIKAVLFVACLLVSGSALAEGVLGPAANPIDRTTYDYRTTIRLQEEFMTGLNGNGTTGSLGWGVAGTVTGLVGEAGRFGILRRDTTAASGTGALLVLYPLQAAVFDPALPHTVFWITRLNNIDANVTMRLGESNGNTSGVPSSGIYFEKLDADTNWFCVTRAVTVQTGTRIDSGVAVDTNFHNFRLRRNAAGVTFTIDGVPVCGVLSANIPTVFIEPWEQMVNSAAASKTYDTDYFEMEITGLNR